MDPDTDLVFSWRSDPDQVFSPGIYHKFTVSVKAIREAAKKVILFKALPPPLPLSSLVAKGFLLS